jgi:hypothetical protein
MASLVSDLCRFSCIVVSRWQALVTGSLFTAGVFLYEHLSKKMLPGNLVLWGAAAFFVTGTFMAWREEYRSDRPIEIRDRLDAYHRRGQKLFDLWMKKRCPKIRTNIWNRSVIRFVKKHFPINHYDHFRSNIVSNDKLAMEIALKLSPSSCDTAQLLGTRLEAIKQLRYSLHD